MQENYELMLLIEPGKEGEIKTLLEKRIKNLCKVIEERNLGIRKLAYRINKQKEGAYFLLFIKAERSKISEIRRILEVSPFVWRLLLIKLKKDLPLTKLLHTIRDRVPKTK
jgi:ribosomal protein S6